MAADFIAVNRAKQLGSSLVRAADLLRELRELVDKISDAKDHSFTGVDYSVMEANFGLAAGAGANVATLLGLVQTILNTNTDVVGATRMSQLDEFCARLSGQ
jgi:hypothetical protein